jgi:ketosteroid isomerase-like protein
MPNKQSNQPAVANPKETPMKQILVILTLAIGIVFFSSCATTAEQASSSPSPSATARAEAGANAEQDVRAIQQEYDKAWVQQDTVAFERLLADDYTLTDQEGKVTPRAEVIATAKAGDIKYEIGKSKDVKILFYDNTALVTGRWREKSTNKGKPFDATSQYTTVYVKRNGRWQIVSDQVTVIAPQKPKA